MHTHPILILHPITDHRRSRPYGGDATAGASDSIALYVSHRIVSVFDICTLPPRASSVGVIGVRNVVCRHMYCVRSSITFTVLQSVHSAAPVRSRVSCISFGLRFVSLSLSLSVSSPVPALYVSRVNVSVSAVVGVLYRVSAVPLNTCSVALLIAGVCGRRFCSFVSNSILQFS